MPLLRSNTADKIIVDRRKPHRNSDVARAVRKTRDRLSQQPGNLAFDRELLKLHARAMAQQRDRDPAAWCWLIAAAGLFAGMERRDPDLGADHRHLLCRRWRWSRRAPTAPTPPTSTSTATQRNFLIAHFVSGLGWAYFASLGCDACQVDQFPVIKAIVLLLAMAATALIASSLRGALAATFALPVAVYAFLGGAPLDAGRAIMVGAADPVAALLLLCRRPAEPTRR